MPVKKYLLLGCALCWPVMAALAAPAGLLDLYQLAKAEDPDFAAAYAGYQGALKGREVGRAGLLPSVSASMSVSRVSSSQVVPARGTAWEHFDYIARQKTIQLSQTIFDWDRISAYNEASARALLAEATLAEARTDLVLRLAQGYFGYLLAIDNVDLAEAQKQALAQQREQADKLYQSGVGTITDVEETRAQHQVALAQYFAAISTIDTRRRELAKIVGVAPPDIRRVAGRIELAAPEPAALEPWLATAAQQNLRVLSKRMSLKVAQTQVERTRAGHLPSLSLQASRQIGDEPNNFTSRDASSRIGLQLSSPLFEGGRVSALGEQAVFQKERARHELESALRESQIKTGQAFLGVVNGVNQVAALELAVKSSQTALKGMQVGQRTGLRTNTDVLNAQQQLFSVKRDLQRERYNYLLSRMQLAAAVGTLSEQDVELVDRLIRAVAN